MPIGQEGLVRLAQMSFSLAQIKIRMVNEPLFARPLAWFWGLRKLILAQTEAEC